MCDRSQSWRWPTRSPSPPPPPRRNNATNNHRDVHDPRAVRDQNHRPAPHPRAGGSAMNAHDARSIDQGHRSAASARASGMRDQEYRPAPRPSAPATRRGVQDARTIRDVGDRPPAAPAAPTAPTGAESNFRGHGRSLASYSNADEELINLPGVRSLMNDIRRDMGIGHRPSDDRTRDHGIEDCSRGRDTWNRPPQQPHAPPSTSGWSRAESPPRRPAQSRYVAPPRSPDPPPRVSKRTPSHSSDCTIISDSDPENPPTAAEIEWYRRRNAEIRAEVLERIRREGDPAGDNGSDCDCSDCRSMDGWRSR